MGVDGLEAIAAEHAALEERPADPSVRRAFRSARRLRRCLEAPEPHHTDAVRLRGLQDDLRDARDLALYVSTGSRNMSGTASVI
ncbi:hypothetical protein ACH35V_28440 [Actinomadura sp. 1N219]|uniref:hypothetical protein n=1 Tax=Actinomadura sp. 1N219 TaxID=3375152 RepID=UPI00378BD57D